MTDLKSAETTQPAHKSGHSHFPATSEQSRCCFRLDDGARCVADRETHSFCMPHALRIRAESAVFMAALSRARGEQS